MLVAEIIYGYPSNVKFDVLGVLAVRVAFKVYIWEEELVKLNYIKYGFVDDGFKILIILKTTIVGYKDPLKFKFDKLPHVISFEKNLRQFHAFPVTFYITW